MGREREAFCGLKNPLNQALSLTMTWETTALSFLGILLDSNQHSHDWQPIRKVWIWRRIRNKVKRIRRQKKAFTFAFRGWTAPYSLEVIIRRTVNRGISNKRKTVVVTPVGYSHAKGEICVLIDELPILDHRRW